MKGTLVALVPLILVAAPLTGYATEQLIPAGSLLHCTVNEPKLSSKTADVGDPVLCQVSHVELYGRSVIPYGSYMVGHFEDYKDPGHLFGKGWMELKFERMIIPPDQIIPVSAKVVYVPKYPTDKQGRIHGKGHPVRDTVEWLIPVLWPIDLINLPRRGPRPELKAETRLTLKVMDDFGVPIPDRPYAPAPVSPYGFSERQPMSYAPAPPPQPAPAPIYSAPPPVYSRPPAYQSYPRPAYQPTAYPYPPPRPATVLVMWGGYRHMARDYWLEGEERLHYVGLDGTPAVLPMEMLDISTTIAVNRGRGVTFAMAAYGY